MKVVFYPPLTLKARERVKTKPENAMSLRGTVTIKISPGLDLVSAVPALVAVGVAAVGVLPVHEPGGEKRCRVTFSITVKTKPLSQCAFDGSRN